MDPDRYCLDEAAPPGSSLHYATLFLDSGERAACVAVHALRHVLLDILDTIADPNVRAHKLNWWSSEIMEARDGRARHPVAVAITRHGTTRIWRRPEVLAMLTAIGRVSAAGGFESEAARDRFCEDVGGGTARLCAVAVAVAIAAGASDTAGATSGTSGTSGAGDGIGALGSALEYATLASAPTARSGLMRIPNATSNAPERMEHDPSNAGAGYGTVAKRSPGRIGRGDHGDPDPAAPQATGERIDSGPGAKPRRAIGKQTGGIPGDPAPHRIAEERARTHQALADAVRDAPLRAGPVALVYRTLAHIQLAALAGALRKPAPAAPLSASITPVRKLWIAWRIARRAD